MAVNFCEVTKSGLRGCGSSTAMISLMVPGRAENTATRSARKVASPRLWVTNTMVLSVRDSSTERSSPRIMRVCSSSAPNGSSISRMPVSRLSARASAARWRMPPESCAGIVLREVLEPDSFERTLRARLALGPRHPLEHHAEIDVLDHRVPGKQRVLLEHEGDVVRHRPAHRLAGDFHGAGGRRHQAADDVEQGGLAAAARPDQTEQLAARDVERGVAQREHVAGVAFLAELMGDVLDPDRDFARHRIAIVVAWETRAQFRGRNASVMSRLMSGSSGSVFISTKDLRSTASALGSKRPVSENIGISSS